MTTVCACRRENRLQPLSPGPDYKKGQFFLFEQNDSAFYYFNKVALGSRDSLQVAMAYNQMGVIQSDAGDYYGSQESLLSSLKYLHEKDPKDFACLASTYNELGTTSLNLKNYRAAIGYYDQSLKLTDDENFIAVILNNKAVTYQRMGLYPEAIDIYQSARDKVKNDKRQYARVLSNLAKVRWLKDPHFQAAPDLLAALQIRKDEKDDRGLDASYSHLSDYYVNTRPDSALIYSRKLNAVARALNSPDDELEAIEKLIKLSPPQDLKPYFARYQFLIDSLQTTRNAAKNQFALIRYEAEKNKSENLQLQKENAEKRVQIIQQQVILYATILVVVLAVFVGIRWYRTRQQKMKDTIRENDLKTSQKVHDVVANGLYRIMTELEYSQIIDKEPLIDKIEDLYERSRDISYEPPQIVHSNFQQTITDLLFSFSGPKLQVNVAGNNERLWINIKDETKRNLEHIMQELMINMKKHSHALNVTVKFEQENDRVRIMYKDDGVGLPPGFRRGNGLTNTENRILAMGGGIIFGQAPKGLKIDIHLPIG